MLEHRSTPKQTLLFQALPVNLWYLQIPFVCILSQLCLKRLLYRTDFAVKNGQTLILITVMRKYPAWFGKRITKKGHEFSSWYLVGTLLHSEGRAVKPAVAIQ